MKNKLKLVVSIGMLLVLIGGLAIGAYLLVEAQNKNNIANADYSIIVDDEITVYAGESYSLIPYLIRRDGTVEESRFQYTSSTEAISVSEYGVVSVNDIPEENETTVISILERNTSTTASVKVDVVSRLTNVLGLTFSDTDGNKTLITGSQELVFDDEYSIDVVTEPKNVDLKDYCDIVVTDADGHKVDAFEFDFNKTNITLHATGLGAGKLSIGIKNDDDVNLFNAQMDFTIAMQEAQLGEDILESQNSQLLSGSDIDNIETITLSENIANMTELDGFGGLKTIVLPSTQVMELQGVSDKYCYRVKESVFSDYLESVYWYDLIFNLIPYEESPEEIYIVYHNDKLNEGESGIFYTRVSEDGFHLPTLEYVGYLNVGWCDGEEQNVTVEDITKISRDGIHLFAVWDPIKFTLRYNVRDKEIAVEEQWDFETYQQLKDLPEVSDKKVTGYKFVGWTTDINTIYDNARYVKGESYGQESITTTNEAVIDLYDVWSPIEYILRFESELKYQADAIEDIIVKYNEDRQIPSANARGYTFQKWTYNETEYSAGSSIRNLSETDGDLLVFKSQWTENQYVLKFDPNGGSAKDGTSFNTLSVTLKYTDPYVLKELTRVGYTSYYWYADIDGDGRQDEDEPTYNITATISRVIGSGEVTLRAVWSQGTYLVTYNLNGGDSLVNGSNQRYEFEESFNLPSARRTGYTLTGWEYNGRTYSVNQTVNKMTATDGGTVTFTAQWRANNYTIIYLEDGREVSRGTCTYNANFTLKAKYTIVGYDITGWIYNGQSYNAGATVKVYNASGTANLRLDDFNDNATFRVTAIKSVHKHKITKHLTNASVTIKDASNREISDLNNVAYNTHVYVSVSYSKGENRRCSYSYNNNKNNCKSNPFDFYMPDYDVDIEAYSECFAEGTRILMADGQYEEIENIKLGDMIMTWDFFTGKLVAAPVVLYYDHGKELAEIINLGFSDGQVVKVIGDHGFFDYTTNRFEYITKDNFTNYIGHQFIDIENDTYSLVTLDYVNITNENVGCYSLMTAYNGNAIAEGKLSLTPQSIDGLFEFFEVGDGLKYDEEKMNADIEQYGLYSYDEWSEYLTEDVFELFNGKYFKILVGKGLLTKEEIVYLIYNELM